MARVALLTQDTAEPGVASLLEPSSNPLNLLRVLAHAPTCAGPQMRLGRALLAELELSHRDRELLVLLCSAMQSVDYEWHQHVPIALSLGISGNQIDAVRGGNFANVFESDALALLNFAQEVIANVRVADHTFAKARHYYTDRELIEAILVVGYYMTMGRILEVTETELELDEERGLKLFNGEIKKPRRT